ncbi:MAG TPA: hypothetical protein VIK51_06740 [Vicinamibacteria bacterium]|jgi:hypothetical protein
MLSLHTTDPTGPRRRSIGALTALAAALLAAPSAQAGVWQASGTLVDLSIEVEGAAAPLYPARDGSGRYYLEARAGCAYTVRVANHSPERLGVVVSVDGLNAISGERELGPSDPARRGRMYVIDPWDEVRVRGWRTSLEDVRRFTFVDERGSYAARTGRANGKMGWIQAWVYRERFGPRVSPPWPGPWDRRPYPPAESEDRPRREGAVPGASDKAEEAPPSSAPAPPDAAATPEKRSSDGALRKLPDGGGAYPGTGWGSQAWDPAMVVRFDAQPRPADTVTVRYEYAPALRALGLLSPPWDPDRLRERERGDGFARPPAW